MYKRQITNSNGDTLGVASYQNTLGLNNDMYFIADTANAGLWKTDGTAAGTVRVWNTNTQYSWPIDLTLTTLNNEVYFFAVDTGGIYQLAKTDGTTTGSNVVHKFKPVSYTHLDVYKRQVPGAASSNPNRYYAYKDKLYFIAGLTSNNFQLYITDGTDTGTRLISPITPLIYGAANYAYTCLLYTSRCV